MGKLNFDTFFGGYIFIPTSPDLSKSSQNKALAITLASGILSLGLIHLAVTIANLIRFKGRITKNLSQKIYLKDVNEIFNNTFNSEERNRELQKLGWTSETRETFIEEVQEISISEKKESDKPSSLSKIKSSAKTEPKFRQPFIDRCLKELMNVTMDKEVLEKIDMLSGAEWKAFVEGLTHKEKQKSLEKLWLLESQAMIGQTENKNREERLRHIFPLLSDSQFLFSLGCGPFLVMMNQKVCSSAAAACFSCDQLRLFALDRKRHGVLVEIIKAFPSDGYLLEKLIAIIPHATSVCQKVLFSQISHLPVRKDRLPDEKGVSKYPEHVKFIKKLDRLTWSFIIENEKKIIRMLQEISKGKVNTASPSKKWPTVQTGGKVYRRSSDGKRENFTEQQILQFILDLKNPSYDLNYLNNKINRMSDHTLKQLIKNLDSPQVYYSLEQLWKLDARYLSAHSEIEKRNHHLGIIFESLSEGQLKFSIGCESFLKIIADASNGISEIAADHFTKDQIVAIADDWKTHQYLFHVIKKLNQSSFQEILPKMALLMSPWLLGLFKDRIEKWYKVPEKADWIRKCESCALERMEGELLTQWNQFHKNHPSW